MVFAEVQEGCFSRVRIFHKYSCSSTHHGVTHVKNHSVSQPHGTQELTAPDRKKKKNRIPCSQCLRHMFWQESKLFFHYTGGECHRDGTGALAGREKGGESSMSRLTPSPCFITKGEYTGSLGEELIQLVKGLFFFFRPFMSKDHEADV